MITTKSLKETKDNLKELSDILTDAKGNKHKFALSTAVWLGLTDEKNEGIWTQLDSSTGKPDIWYFNNIMAGFSLLGLV